MQRWFRMAIVIVAIVTGAAVSLHTDESQSPQKPAAVQGRAGTPPGPEAPLEPNPPATVKEGDVWIPPLRTPEEVAPPAGWVTSGPDVPPMPLTLLRLPRTNITRAKFPAIDVHVHAPQLTTAAAYQSLIALMDSIGMGALVNLNGGTGPALDAALKAGEPYRDEYFYHPAQIRTPGGSPGHGRWNISGVGLPDAVLRKIYYQNALRHLPSLRPSIERQLAALSR